MGQRSHQPLDVIIPLIEKDLETAKEAIHSVRAMVFHPIREIYLVALESSALRQFAHEMKCKFILENDGIEDYEAVKKLGGWILQQLIKLNADKISSNQNILILDADTILLRPQVFIDDNTQRYTFHIHSDYTDTRKKFTRELLKTNIYFKLDFVSHHMVINQTWLKELKTKIEQGHKQKWYQAIIRLVGENPGGLSEYDIYATYVFLNYPHATRLFSSANTFLYRDRFKFFHHYYPIYAADYKSLSSHSFMKFSDN